MAPVIILDEKKVIFWTGAAVLLLALGGCGWVLWIRSEKAAVLRALQSFRRIQRESVPTSRFLDALGMDRPAGRRSLFLKKFAGDLGKISPRTAKLADYVVLQAHVVELLDRLGKRPSSGQRHELAALLDALVDALEEHAYQLSELGRIEASNVALERRLELHLSAELLRIENVVQFAARRSDFEGKVVTLLHLAKEVGGSPNLLEYTGVIQECLQHLEELDRLTFPEERAVALAPVLPLVLKVRRQVEGELVANPLFSLTVRWHVIESLHQIVSTFLQTLGQHAKLTVELQSRVLTSMREATVVVDVHNAGPGNAQSVVVELHANDDLFTIKRPQQSIRQLLRGQSARLEFQIKPRTSDRFRMLFRVVYSDLERARQELEYADIIELRPEKESSFFPLHPNPYVVGRPLRDEDVFISRDETLAEISSLLEKEGSHLLVLVGQRRMGKTSILRRLRHHLPGYVAALVDLQGMLVNDEGSFVHELIIVLQDELNDMGIEVESPSLAEMHAEPMEAFRQIFLKRVLRSIGERKILMMIDEFEILEEHMQSGVLTPMFLAKIIDLLRELEGVRLLFSGTQRLNDLTVDSWHVLTPLAQYLNVGHFSQDQIAELFMRPFDSYATFDPLALEKAYRLTGGHPHFSQLLARELVEMRNLERLNYITVQDVNKVADVVVDKGQLHIVYIWNEASRDERLLMLTVRELIDREGLASMAGAVKFLEARRIETSDLQAAATLLKRKEILDSDTEHLSFRMELLAKWLRQARSLEAFSLTDQSGTTERPFAYPKPSKVGS